MRKLSICSALIVAVALSSSLGACGKVGSLDRPAPLFGRKAKAEYAAEKRRERAQRRANKAGDKGGDPAPPAPDYGQGDPSLAPMRASPVPGAANNPFGNSSPGGLMQDPVANPNALPH